MISCIRRLKRSYQSLSAFKRVTCVGLTVFILWVLGILDKVREEDFNNFSWPRTSENEIPIIKFEQLPKCRFDEAPGDTRRLMIIVKSSAKNEVMREAVRRTWGHYRKESGFEIMPIFVVGYADSSELRRRVDKESERYDDILLISTLDSYRNNTFKLFAAVDYAASPIGCASPDFLFLVDDDYIVHIPNIIKFATTKKQKDPIYEGFVFDSSPFRMKIHKHRVSLSEYPYSRYPPYVSAGAVFLTSETVTRFKTSMRTLKIFPFDDVFTGILAKMVNVPATHNENFIFWSRRVSLEEWKNGIIAVHGYARKDLEYEYNNIFGYKH